MGNRTRNGLIRGLQTRRHPLALAITIALAATPAWAEEQDAAQQEELQTIEVNAEQNEDAYGADDFGYVGQRSMTATKTDTPVSETPRSISIVTREQMNDRAAVSISDALRYTPGMQAGFYGEDNKQDWFIVRGFKQANNGLYRDGTRTYSNGFYSWQIDPFLLERVEILRGPSSVLYGQTPPGGVINVISKRPQDYSFGSIGVAYGSYDRKQVSVDAGTALGDGHAVRVVALARENGTQVDDVEQERVLFAPSLKLNLGDATDLTLLASYQEDNSDPYLQFHLAEGTLNPSSTGNGFIDEDVAVGNPDYERFDRTQLTFGYQLDHAFSEQTSFQQNVRYGRIDIDLRQMYALAYADDFGIPTNRTEVVRFISTEDGHADSVNADNRLTHKWEFNGMEHTLLAGADYQLLKIDGKDYAADPVVGDAPGVPNTLNVYNPEYANANDIVLLDSSTFMPLTEADLQRRTTDSYQIGFYLQDQVKIQDHLVATLGVRHDRVDSEFENKATGVEQDLDGDEWTANAGLAWLFDNGVTAYTSYSQFFQPILQLDANNEPAKPEQGDQIEVGLKVQPDGFDGYVNLAAFKINHENLSSGTAGSPTFQQIGEVESEGVELEAVANITPAWSLVANATYVDPKIVSDARGDSVEGNQPNQVAKELYSAWTKYQFLNGPLKGLSVGAGGRYVGSTYGDDLESESMRVPSYTVWDATVGYQWDDFKFQVAAKNVFDKEYVATCNYWCWYGDRPSVIGSVTYAW
ncbi:MAG: TonB-dependent siderophore receptor [Pseudomonadota bacterium]|nr:TonB-dependent siderophore receptor [Pseudomonadota bacterium]